MPILESRTIKTLMSQHTRTILIPGDFVQAYNPAMSPSKYESESKTAITSRLVVGKVWEESVRHSKAAFRRIFAKVKRSLSSKRPHRHCKEAPKKLVRIHKSARTPSNHPCNFNKPHIPGGLRNNVYLDRELPTARKYLVGLKSTYLILGDDNEDDNKPRQPPFKRVARDRTAGKGVEVENTGQRKIQQKQQTSCGKRKEWGGGSWGGKEHEQKKQKVSLNRELPTARKYLVGLKATINTGRRQ
jgi:hypothetical protein